MRAKAPGAVPNAGSFLSLSVWVHAISQQCSWGRCHRTPLQGQVPARRSRHSVSLGPGPGQARSSCCCGCPCWPWLPSLDNSGQEVTLTCHGSSFESPGQTTWFHLHQDNETSRRTPGSTWVVRESGQYRCQAGRSRPSSPVHLTFSRASLILQAPPAVFEGDTVLLRCQGKVDSELHNKTLYRNGRALAWLGGRSGFLIHAAALRDNGAYHCTAEREAAASATSNTVEIQVQELFPRPVLTASPARPVEGDPVTLTCETQLPPQRQDVQLRFRFYRDNQPLGFGRSWSPELRIPTVRREDSESYWCQAETMIQSITKRSLKSYIPVQRVTASVHVYTRPAPDLVFEGQELVLTCSVTGIPEPVRISWFRSSRPVRTQASGRAELRIAKVEGGSAGEYYCVARTGHRSFSSQPVAISVKVPVSRPVLTLSPAGPWALEGDTMTFHCEARRGSAPILYQFFHEGALVRKLRAASSGGSSFSVSLTAEHSGSYHCTADNGLGAQPSEAESLSINVPVSRPVLTLSPPGPRALKGDVMTLHCEARRGSSYILYRFYCEDVVLGSRQAPSGAGASFRLALREEHSANYSCTADNGFGPPQRSEAVSLWVVAPVSRPVLTVGAPGARAAPGDVLRLHCEAPRGSPPILYRFYRGDDALGSSQAPSGGGASLNLSVTEEHSGNYSCEADNGLGAQRSEAVTLHVTGLPRSRRGSAAAGVTGVLVSMAGLAALALLFSRWLLRKEGERPAIDPPSSPSAADPQEPTYHNVPAWLEMQPVYGNVNPKDVVYTEVRHVPEKHRRPVTTLPAPAPDMGGSVIYSQVKVASALASRPQLSAPSAPHR
ncbi:Fc receptor-like protein 5 isoform X2 [Rousettus aegyptiacus]|uniref:Fc receptor-like protein 5 isoform X2 n=1 Tax=Rousettus aegyptiacus TaxID=9407 RepID=UPI00168D0A0B|nr:Fc receptor-like protein 5 isoform X2 [Rousettus aegyptiacus]